MSTLQMPEHIRKENAFLCGVIAHWAAQGGSHKLPTTEAGWWLNMYRKGLSAKGAVEGVIEHVAEPHPQPEQPL